MTTQIFAMGGGGFSMAENPAIPTRLDAHFFSLAGSDRPRVCFLGTASGDADSYVEKFYTAMEKFDVDPVHLSLFRPHTNDFDTFFSEPDVFYVGGGNTKNLVVLWREWGVDRLLQTAAQNGAVLGGLSAGAICWFEQGVTDSMSPPDSGVFHSMQCVGMLPESCCPHFDGEPTRRSEYHRLVQSGEICGGYAIDDDVAIHFVDGAVHEVVSEREDATAYSVSVDGENALPVDTKLWT